MHLRSFVSELYWWRLYTSVQNAAVMPYSRSVYSMLCDRVIEYSAVHISCPTTTLSPSNSVIQASVMEKALPYCLVTIHTANSGNQSIMMTLNRRGSVLSLIYYFININKAIYLHHLPHFETVIHFYRL